MSSELLFGDGDPVTVRLFGDSGDAYVAAFDEVGQLQWARRIDGASQVNTLPTGITALPDGRSVVTGRFRTAATFGPGEAGAVTLSTFANRDAGYIAGYSP